MLHVSEHLSSYLYNGTVVPTWAQGPPTECTETLVLITMDRDWPWGCGTLARGL